MIEFNSSGEGGLSCNHGDLNAALSDILRPLSRRPLLKRKLNQGCLCESALNEVRSALNTMHLVVTGYIGICYVFA